MPHPTEIQSQTWVQRTYGGYTNMLVSRGVRSLIGLVLFGIFCIWLFQNDSVPAGDLTKNTAAAIEKPYDALAKPWEKDGPAMADAKFTKPHKVVKLPLVPNFLCDLFSTYNTGVAGLILLVSGIFTGKKLGFILLPAAAFIFIGHWLGVEVVSPLGHTSLKSASLYPTTMLLGLVAAGFGFWKFRD